MPDSSELPSDAVWEPLPQAVFATNDTKEDVFEHKTAMKEKNPYIEARGLQRLWSLMSEEKKQCYPPCWSPSARHKPAEDRILAKRKGPPSNDLQRYQNSERRERRRGGECPSRPGPTAPACPGSGAHLTPPGPYLRQLLLPILRNGKGWRVLTSGCRRARETRETAHGRGRRR
uniref:B box-binding protein-like n=1 Tax=Nyctereutes procyonoides TaxID=34880 RepID=UPI0024449ED2|nr:B box-binding protein-like [Nyctereutes procyonoides]